MREFEFYSLVHQRVMFRDSRILRPMITNEVISSSVNDILCSSRYMCIQLIGSLLIKVDQALGQVFHHPIDNYFWVEIHIFHLAVIIMNHFCILGSRIAQC